MEARNNEGSLMADDESLLTNPPTAPQFVGIAANNQDCHFHSVVAETTVP